MNEHRFIVYKPESGGECKLLDKTNDLTEIILSMDRLVIIDQEDQVIYILLDNENINPRLKVTLAWAAQQLHKKIKYPVINVSKKKLKLISKRKFSFRLNKKDIIKKVGLRLFP